MRYNIAVALILLVFLVGCGEQTITGKVVSEPIKIGWAGPLTSSEASLGVSNLQGIEVAVNEINSKGGINGRALKLITEDTQEDPKLTMNAYLKLKNIDDVDVLLTSSYNGMFQIQPIAEKEGLVVINTLDTSNELAALGKNMFAVGIYDEGIGYTIANFVKNNLQDQNVAIIAQQGDVMKLFSDSVEEKLTVKTVERYAPETTDFRSTLTKLKAKGITTYIVIGYDEVGLLLKQAKELGIEANFVGIDTMTSSGFLKNAAGAEEGTYFTFWEMGDSALSKKVLEKIVTRYGKRPDAEIFTATGYDSVMVLAEALKIDKPLNEALYDVKNVAGVTGNLTMSNDGVVRNIEEVMYQIQNGKFVKLSQT